MVMIPNSIEQITKLQGADKQVNEDNNKNTIDNNSSIETNNIDSANESLLVYNNSKMLICKEELQPLALQNYTKIVDDNNEIEKDIDYVGLSREELIKCANDPYWIRLRLILLIFFWFVWSAMVFSAIMYIVYSQKCINFDDLWWKKGPLTETLSNDDLNEFLKSPKVTKFQGVIINNPDSISYLKEAKINGILDIDVVNLFKSNETWDSKSDHFVITVKYEKISEKFLNWIKQGFLGFRLYNIPDSIVKVNDNRVITMKETIKFQFFTELKNLIKIKTKQRGVLIGCNVGNIESIFDLLQTTISDQDILSVEALKKKIQKSAMKNSIWKISDSIAVNNEYLDATIFLLPGTPLINAFHFIDESLLELRSLSTILNGSYKNYTNSEYFAYHRYSEDESIYLIFTNLHFDIKTIHLNALDYQIKRFKVVYSSKPITEMTITNDNVPNKLELLPSSVLILKYNY